MSKVLDNQSQLELECQLEEAQKEAEFWHNKYDQLRQDHQELLASYMQKEGLN